VGGRRLAILVGVLVHVEGHQVTAGQFGAVDHLRRDRVLGNRPHGQDEDALASGLGRRPDALDDVDGEPAVELDPVVDDLDAKLLVRVPRDVLAADGADPGAGLLVAERDELRHRVVERHHSPFKGRVFTTRLPSDAVRWSSRGNPWPRCGRKPSAYVTPRRRKSRARSTPTRRIQRRYSSSPCCWRSHDRCESWAASIFSFRSTLVVMSTT